MVLQHSGPKINPKTISTWITLQNFNFIDSEYPGSKCFSSNVEG